MKMLELTHYFIKQVHENSFFQEKFSRVFVVVFNISYAVEIAIDKEWVKFLTKRNYRYLSFFSIYIYIDLKTASKRLKKLLKLLLL